MSHGARDGHPVHPDRPQVLGAAAARTVADTMQALATPSRVRILSCLADAPSAVGDLAEAIEMEPSAVSQQLRVLRHLGLVVGERSGRQVIYGLHDDHVRTLLHEAISHSEHLRLGLADAPSAAAAPTAPSAGPRARPAAR